MTSNQLSTNSMNKGDLVSTYRNNSTLLVTVQNGSAPMLKEKYHQD